MVTKDASRPFVVNANDKMSVEVLGTQFNLQAYPDDTFVETTLNDGAVRVFNGKQGVKLRPDEPSPFMMKGNSRFVRLMPVVILHGKKGNSCC